MVVDKSEPNGLNCVGATQMILPALGLISVLLFVGCRETEPVSQHPVPEIPPANQRVIGNELKQAASSDTKP